MRQVTSGRAKLAVEVLGSGDPVVFLHAAVCDSRMWQAQMQAVSATHMAIAYDRRGFGKTVAEKEDHSAVADLVAVLDAVAGDKPAILVCCSQGGRIALDAALMHPQKIRGLALISPSVFGAPEPVYPPAIQALIAAQKAAQDAGDLERLNAIKAHLWLDGALQPEGRVSGPVRDLFLDMDGIVLRSPPVGPSVDNVPNFQRLGEITAPTLIICGEYDFPTIVERCRHMAAAMPKATHHALPGTAHVPSLDKPAEISALVTDFIGRIE